MSAEEQRLLIVQEDIPKLIKSLTGFIVSWNFW